MAGWCEEKDCEISGIRESQLRVLLAVLAINATMFLRRRPAGLLAHTISPVADAFDMFGDALACAFSLFRAQAYGSLIDGVRPVGHVHAAVWRRRARGLQYPSSDAT